MIVIVLKNKTEPVLVFFSESYSKLETISVSTSRLSPSSALYCLLTTYTTNYYFNSIINNFDLKMSFYSK